MIVEQFLINKAKEIDNPISNWGIGFTAEVIREWVELQGLVKMNTKKVLQDYISYQWIEEFITDEQKDAMLKNLGVYIKGMIPQLTIHSVVSSFFTAEDVGGNFEIISNSTGHDFEIGETVSLMELNPDPDDDQYKFEGKDDYWWCGFADVKKL